MYFCWSHILSLYLQVNLLVVLCWNVPQGAAEKAPLYGLGSSAWGGVEKRACRWTIDYGSAKTLVLCCCQIYHKVIIGRLISLYLFACWINGPRRDLEFVAESIVDMSLLFPSVSMQMAVFYYHLLYGFRCLILFFFYKLTF